MTNARWYYMIGEEPEGPVPWSRIVDLWRAGQIKSYDLVRSEDSFDWLTLSNAYDIALREPSEVEVLPEAGKQKLTDERGWSTDGIAPWRRYGARFLDTTINGFLGGMVIVVAWTIVAPISAERFFAMMESSPGTLFLETFILTIISAIVGGIVIGVTGTSVGKAIFGVKVLGLDGVTIGVLEGWRREAKVWVIGMACGLPIINLWTMLVANRRLREKGSTSWDEGRHLVFYRPAGTFQSTMNGIGILLIILILAANRLA